MKTKTEKAIIFLSTCLVIFSALLISYSGINAFRASSLKESPTNQLQFNTVDTSEVLGASSIDSTEPATDSNTQTTPQTSNKAQVSPQTNFVASTQYVNSTREPLSNIKPKDFYFTTANTNLDSKRFRVKYEDGTYSGYKNIESIEGIKDDSGVEMSKASIIYKETKNFTDIEVENNPGDITITFIGDPANLNAAAYGVNYTYETEYKKKLFTNFGINLITREEWGAPSYSEWTPQFSKITRVVVHHTATNVDFSSTDVTVRAIYNEHKIRCSDNSGYYPSNCSIDNTWSDIGYNYLIDPYGNIFEGRSGGNGVIGAHSIPNQGSIGISLLGNYSTTQPPAVMMASLTKLIGAVSFLNDFKVVWQQSLLGHRDYLNTECPGANIYPVLPQIAINSEAARQSYNASQNRDLIGKMSFGQDFIRSNPQITDGGGNSHVYLIADNIDAQMKLKIKSTSTWSGTNGAAIYGENVLVYINKSLAPAFIGEVGLSIPGIQFSTDLP